jgi:hypothetical protein
MLDIFNLVKKGVETASFLFGKVREFEGHLNAVEGSVPTSHYDDQKLISAIDDVSQKIDAVAHSIVAGVSEKLEFDQLQKLGSQVKVLKSALEFGKENMIVAALTPLAEQVQYSKLRIVEGKQEWIGPWMIGESIRLAAMQTIAADDRERAFVSREIINFRVQILDSTGEFLLRSIPSPWMQISDFVEGRNERLLDNLDAIMDLEKGERTKASKSERVKKEQPSDAKAVLAPAAAWPFPSSTRPS